MIRKLFGLAILLFPILVAAKDVNQIDFAATATEGSEFNGKSTLYIFGNYPSMPGPRIFIDEVKVGAIGSITYMKTGILPGDRHVLIAFIDGTEIFNVVLHVEAGKTYYLAYGFEPGVLQTRHEVYTVDKTASDEMVNSFRHVPSIDSQPKSPLTVAEAIEMLKSPNTYVLQLTAKTLVTLKPQSVEEFDKISEVLNAHLSAENKPEVDAMAYLCKVIGSSKNGRYKEFLTLVSKSAKDSKLKGYAKDAAADLPKTSDAVFIP